MPQSQSQLPHFKWLKTTVTLNKTECNRSCSASCVFLTCIGTWSCQRNSLQSGWRRFKSQVLLLIATMFASLRRPGLQRSCIANYLVTILIHVGLPMLGYMEQTVATCVIKALTAAGTFKPKYPFLTPTRSALLYVAFHLKGNHNTNEMAFQVHESKIDGNNYRIRCDDLVQMIKLQWSMVVGY